MGLMTFRRFLECGRLLRFVRVEIQRIGHFKKATLTKRSERSHSKIPRTAVYLTREYYAGSLSRQPGKPRNFPPCHRGDLMF